MSIGTSYSYGFVGHSPAIKSLQNDVDRVAKNQTSVLIRGESGTGKELVAKTLHQNSYCYDKAFLAINCGAIPENLLESELFGYRRGAFTDAHEDKVGLIERAAGGTLFLDEIAELPLTLQVKLLRVLDQGEILPLGASEPVQVRFRLVCATNKDLEAMIRHGEFRADLYYRINVVTIRVPALRNRLEDLSALVGVGMQIYASENEVAAKSVSKEVLDRLKDYHWPGNVRELFNVVYNLALYAETRVVQLKDLENHPELFHYDDVNLDPHDPLLELSQMVQNGEINLSQAKQEFERLHILKALQKSSWNITNASHFLQMPRPQVSRLVKKYGLKELAPVTA